MVIEKMRKGKATWGCVREDNEMSSCCGNYLRQTKIHTHKYWDRIACLFWVMNIDAYIGELEIHMDKDTDI